MSTAYEIKSLTGAYLRETMRRATGKEAARATLIEAMGYLGHTDPTIMTWDDGTIVAYYDAADAESDPDGSKARMVASPAARGEEA